MKWKHRLHSSHLTKLELVPVSEQVSQRVRISGELRLPLLATRLFFFSGDEPFALTAVTGAASDWG
jgi:hypothetical protein